MINKNIIHLSFDDVINSFYELNTKLPQSIFRIGFFAFLHNLHTRTGCVVSCYCFYKKDGFCLADCPNSYRHEFESNSDWLKFGFHSYTGNEDYLHQDPSISLAQYDELMMNLERVVGKMSLDLFPRIHKFEASEEFIRLISNHTLYPIKGILAADDNRVSYSLTNANNEVLIKKRYFKLQNIVLLRTSQRYDSLKPISFFKLFNHSGAVILFTHEWYFYNNNWKIKTKGFVIRLLIHFSLQYYKFKGFKMAFPTQLI